MIAEWKKEHFNLNWIFLENDIYDPAIILVLRHTMCSGIQTSSSMLCL